MMVEAGITAELAASPMVGVLEVGRCSAAAAKPTRTVETHMLVVRVPTKAMVRHMTRHHEAVADSLTAKAVDNLTAKAMDKPKAMGVDRTVVMDMMATATTSNG